MTLASPSPGRMLHIDGIREPLLTLTSKPAESEAGRTIVRMALDNHLEETTHGLLCPKEMLTKSFWIEDLPPKGEKIGMTIYPDASLLIWRSYKQKAKLIPLVFSLSQTLGDEPFYLLAPDDEYAAQGPMLAPKGYLTKGQSPIFFLDQISDPVHRRWAARLRSTLLQYAWGQSQRFDKAPVTLKTVPRNGYLLHPAIAYHCDTNTFVERVTQWATHALVREGQRKPCRVHINSAHRDKALDIVESSVTFDNLELEHLVKKSFTNQSLLLKTEFETLRDKSAFGPKPHHFSCQGTNSALRIASFMVDPQGMSAHQTLDALSWTPESICA